MLASPSNRGRLRRLACEDGDDLVRGEVRLLSQRLFGHAPERVRDHRPAHVWHAGRLRGRLARRDEYVGRDQDGGDAALFQFDAVEQTARAAAPSIAVREDDGVTAL